MLKIRERLSMDNGWRFILGDIDADKKIPHELVCHFTKAGEIIGPGGYKYDDSEWNEVNVPHDWAIEQDFNENAIPVLGYKPTGVGWYRKTFSLNKEDRGKHILLEFDGIATKSTIYFNGSIVHRNWSGYNSFSVDISDRVFFDNKPNIL